MPLAKSYSANIGHHKRDSWQRSHSTPVGGRFESRAGSAVSSAAKKKLEKLKYRPQNTDLSISGAVDSNKENNRPATEADDDPNATQPDEDIAPNSSRPRKPDETPVTKYDWARIGDSGGNDEDHQISPSDRIMWVPQDNGEMNYPRLSELVRPKKGRKRARSSSPTSSPLDKANSPAVNIKKLSQALKSPHSDPTLELWDRYTMGLGGNGSEPDTAGKGFADLLISSSPKSAANGMPRGEGGLRRAITSSRLNFNKRRKIEVESESPMVGDAEGPSKYSLVSSLLVSVAANMQESPLKNVQSAARRNAEDGPWTRDQEATGAPIPESPSPPKRRRPSPPPGPAMGVFKKPIAPASIQKTGVVNAASMAAYSAHTSNNEAKKRPQDAASDYGDDDFDDDMFMELDAQVENEPVISCVPQGSSRKAGNVGASASPVTVTRGAAMDPISIHSQSSGNLAKEYGDLGDDEFLSMAAEIKDLAATSRKSPPKPPARPTAADTAAGADDAMSDYGLDDFDDVDDETLIEMPDQTLGDTTVISTRQKAGGRADSKSVVAYSGLERDLLGDDDFDDDVDWDAIEQAASQAVAARSSNVAGSGRSQKPKKTIQRYLITAVLDGNQQQPEKILVVKADSTEETKTVHLRGEWCETEAKIKSYVHVIGEFRNGRCIIDDNQNILILHPDQLISATVVADSFGCMRRAVLQDRVKATSDPTPPLVYGTLLHEIFQEALTAMRWDPLFLTNVIHAVTEKHVEDLYTIKIGMAAAREHLESKMGEMRNWAMAFVAAEPKAEALVQDRMQKKVNMCISKLLDVEEHVWSPMYGLKGNIDATVQVTIKDGADSRTLTVPFEVKTGKRTSTHHTAQTALYNLLLSDRYDIDVTCGILYYTETSLTMRVPTIRRELRQMIMQRNRLAAYVRDRSVQLPDMAKRQDMCRNCYAQTSCFIYHRLADGGDGETSGLGNKFDEVIKHLTPAHQEFFVKWENLLTMEERESQKLKRELWTMVSTEREKVGRCFADMVIDQILDGANPSRINRYQYVMVKRNPAPRFSFLESQLAMGEPVVVSDEKGHFALAVGYVTAVRKNRITIAVDRRLHNARVRQPGFDEVNNQVFAGIMEAKPRGALQPQPRPRPVSSETEPPQIRYRLDKDEFSNGMATVRNNLVQVMADGVFGSREIRRLVVDLVAPRFKPVPTQYTISSSGHDSLNVDQKRAIEKVMSAQDYALVLGMPGTGKTTTIAHIIRALVSKGKSVLLTSYTHTAVDNILLKLRKDRLGILRLGAPAKVHPDVQSFVTLAGVPMTSFEQIKAAWHDSPVVATTCLGISHPIFNERTFDYCIVDEASQITLPICLGPIRMAKTFVLVGDHNQLPPLVQNENAREGGLDVSLFKLLSDTHPDSVVNLEHQYRMCEDIMTLSNTLIYRGRLRCGTEELKTRKLDVPNMKALKARHHDADTIAMAGLSSPRAICTGGSNCWLRQVMDPEARVRFIDTDALSPRAMEEAKGNRIVNPAEAQIVAQLVDSLTITGVPASEIGVMTHYRSQLSLLRHALRHNSGVEMHTADRFQGRDKEVVILSLVRSNEGGNIGDLLKDWRRINVAFTRAKTKLLVVGSRSTLMAAEKEMVARFVGVMEQRGWVYTLGAGALAGHYFEEVTTQRSPNKSPAKKRSPLKSVRGVVGPGGIAALNLGAGKKGGKGGKGGGVLADMEGFGGGLGTEKENFRPGLGAGVRRAGVSERVLLKNRPVTRDILNELSGGAYSY